MSIATYRAVRCDGCGIESQALRSSGEARMLAKREGWRQIRGDDGAQDLCPNCYGRRYESASTEIMDALDAAPAGPETTGGEA